MPKPIAPNPEPAEDGEEYVLPPGLEELAVGMKPAHVQFALCVHNGVNKAAAYRRFFPSCSAVSSWECGSRLSKTPKVATLLAGLCKAECESHLLTVQKKRRILAQIVDLPLSSIYDPATGELNPDLEHLIHEMTIKRMAVGRGDAGTEFEIVKIRKTSVKEALEIDARLSGQFQADQAAPPSGEGLDLVAMMRVPSFARGILENPEIRAVLLEELRKAPGAL